MTIPPGHLETRATENYGHTRVDIADANKSQQVNVTSLKQHSKKKRRGNIRSEIPSSPAEYLLETDETQALLKRFRLRGFLFRCFIVFPKRHPAQSQCRKLGDNCLKIFGIQHSMHEFSSVNAATPNWMFTMSHPTSGHSEENKQVSTICILHEYDETKS